MTDDHDLERQQRHFARDSNEDIESPITLPRYLPQDRSTSPEEEAMPSDEMIAEKAAKMAFFQPHKRNWILFQITLL